MDYDAIKERFGGKVPEEEKKPDAYDEDIKTAFDVTNGYHPLVNSTAQISSPAVTADAAAGAEDDDAVF